jgi:hypothetical protein
MRQIAIQVLSVSVLTLCIAGQSYAAHAVAPIRQCPPAHARIVRSDRQAVIYKVREFATETMETVNGGYEHYRIPVTGIRGCVRGRIRSYKLGEPFAFNSSSQGGSGGGIGSLALAGGMVAFEESLINTGPPEGEPVGNNEWRVVVRDLRTGEVVHKVPTGTQTTPSPKIVGVGPTTAIVVKSDGAVAWIAEAGVGNYEVHALDKTGSRLLASGEDIKPHVLGIKGSRLYWKQGAQMQSAVLS